MSTEQKIEEVLGIAREHGLRLREQASRLEELFQMFLEERRLNNARFNQLATGLMDVRKETSGIKVEMAKMNVDLNAKIDRVYDSLSQDIQVSRRTCTTSNAA
jgi:hypothetical protein